MAPLRERREEVHLVMLLIMGRPSLRAGATLDVDCTGSEQARVSMLSPSPSLALPPSLSLPLPLLSVNQKEQAASFGSVHTCMHFNSCTQCPCVTCTVPKNLKRNRNIVLQHNSTLGLWITARWQSTGLACGRSRFYFSSDPCIPLSRILDRRAHP